MDRTIRIEGTGRASAKPDLIRVTLNVSALDKDYAKVITEADAKLYELNALACGVGLGKNALKTCDFSVASEYRSVRNESGEYRQEFIGYRCRHSLKVEFGFDTTLLGNVLSAFAASNAKPELGVEFALADESGFVRLALAAAVDDAKMRASAIAEAAGVKLDGITSVENCNRGNDFRSNTNVNFESRAVALSAKCASVEPENVETTETVVVTFAVK